MKLTAYQQRVLNVMHPGRQYACGSIAEILGTAGDTGASAQGVGMVMQALYRKGLVEPGLVLKSGKQLWRLKGDA